MKFVLTTAIFLSSIGLAQAANIEKGKTLVEKGNCVACHGAGLNAPVAPVYPKLAGQYADYVYYSLRAYKVGNSNPQFGRNNAVMAVQVKDWTEADMRDIAAYIASLPGSLVVRK